MGNWSLPYPKEPGALARDIIYRTRPERGRAEMRAGTFPATLYLELRSKLKQKDRPQYVIGPDDMVTTQEGAATAMENYRITVDSLRGRP